MSFPEKIKAILIPEQGDLNVIQLGEIPFPDQKPNEVLIKVQYAGVNFLDVYQRNGLYPAPGGRFPFVPGTEAAGTIVKLPSDPQVLEDKEYKVRAFKEGVAAAVMHPGTTAEYISIPWKSVFTLPAKVTAKVGAASALQGLTALTFATEAHDIKKGETVLVHTVAGGLGLILSQIARARGATVIGTTSSEEKAKLAKAHGADHIILYTKEDTVKRVREITNGEGVHASFDGIGKDTLELNLEMLRRKGTLVSFGSVSGPIPPFPPLKLTPKNLKLVRPTVTNYLATPSEFYTYAKELFDLISDGTVKINVYAEYPFTAEGVQQSQKDITGHSTSGKLLIKISD